MRRAISPLILMLAVLMQVLSSSASAQQSLASQVWWTDVRAHGARGDGVADDTNAVRKAITAARIGGVVYFPPGLYRVTDEILITKVISLAGVGRGSQVFQSVDGRNLFTFQNLQGISVKDLYLGSTSTTAGTSLIQLVNTHRSRFDNLTLLGGYYGVHLKGGLLNTFVDLRSGANIGVFFGATSLNQYWVFAERFNNISANANTFIAPCLEGGTNGIRVQDSNAEGSLSVLGGTIEGVTGHAIYLQGTGLPSSIIGTHMELNGLGDVYLDGASRVRVQSVLATTRVEVAGTSLNNTITDALVEKVVIAANARRTVLSSVSLNLSGSQNPDLEDNAGDTQYNAVTDINPFDWFGTIGVGARNPNSNPVGLTPDRKVEIDGELFATRLKTPNTIVTELRFETDGKESMRLSMNQDALMLENLHTGERSRMFTQRDLATLTQMLQEQQGLIQALRVELDSLRGSVTATAYPPQNRPRLAGQAPALGVNSQ